MPNARSPELTVDTDRSDGARDFCSGAPKSNVDNWFGVHGASISALSMDNLGPDTDKSFTCTTISFGFLPTPGKSGVLKSLVGRVDVQRLRGGGCKERAPRDKERLALSLLTGSWSAVVHWTGCCSVRILRSMRRSIESTGSDKGGLAITTTGAVTECLSGVFGRNLPKRLLILVNDSLLTSRSCCLSKSTEIAPDAERGRFENKPFNADTGPLPPAVF